MAAAGGILDAQVMSSGIFLGSRVLLPSSGTRAASRRRFSVRRGPA